MKELIFSIIFLTTQINFASDSNDKPTKIEVPYQLFLQMMKTAAQKCETNTIREYRHLLDLSDCINVTDTHNYSKCGTYLPGWWEYKAI